MFGTSGVRGPFGTDVTADLALSIGRAVAADGADRIVIGRDPRTTGDLLADAVAAGARECGADVIDLGVAATPTIARSVAWQDADAGIAVTASHNPPEDNGIKLWQRSGQAFDEERRERIAERVRADDATAAAWDAVGERSAWDGAADRHVGAIESAVTGGDSTSSLSDLDVVVDVGNGAGGLTVQALRALGCSVTALNERPDGHFPSRPSEPTAETLSTLRSVVAATDADLGVAHDGDADRTMAVDETGAFVRGDALLALFAVDAVRHSAPVDGDADRENRRVAAPVNTSLAVDDALAAVGAEVVRTRVGDVFVAERANEPDVVFGGEPSGAWIWPAETLCPDGPLAACNLAAMVAERGPLSELVGQLDEYPIRRDSREVAEKGATMDRIRAAATAEYADVDDIDGVRITTDDGWLLLRASGTQPLIRLTAEAREPDRADDLLETGHSLLDDALVE
ncbi:phosphoglucosamine mutase [Salinarchaeum chitinilyticum]